MRLPRFDDKRTEDLKTELNDKKRETDTLYKKVGQLTLRLTGSKKI
jgi:hypothetical protein